MIQRAQSVYLLSVSVLMIFMIVLPVAEIAIKGGEIVIYHNYGLKSYSAENAKIIFSTFSVTILTCVIALISFINIFFYNNRNLQMRFCIYNMILLIGLVVLIYFYYTLMRKRLDILNHTFKIAIVFPIISAILTLLSLKGIRRDEALVRSCERLR